MTENKKDKRVQTDQNDRRIALTPKDQDLYKLPKASIDDFIEKERRHDELDRLREVQEQKKVWCITVGLSAFLVIFFLMMLVWGQFYVS